MTIRLVGTRGFLIRWQKKKEKKEKVMLSQVLVGGEIILCGVLLGVALDAIPPIGGRGDWFYFWLVAPAMIVIGGILAYTLGAVA